MSERVKGSDGEKYRVTDNRAKDNDGNRYKVKGSEGSRYIRKEDGTKVRLRD